MWLIQNMGTIVTALVVCGIAFLSARSIWKDKKAGKSCGGCSGCSGCNGGCHSAGGCGSHDN
ncbi:MAG: FeoB-associated Cys-rich membrane protein [Lachnospiraceae bacterium]|nr:FeoB-associated Cys-rich membrane protein [Lachnospiraceae bacterium]